MIVSQEQKLEYLEFANRVLDVNYDPRQCTWITCLSNSGEILAVVIYNTFSKFNCEMSVASNGSRRWMSKEFLRVCFRYPFWQLGLTRITGVVEETNSDALRLDRHLGFIEEARLKCWFGSNDGIAFRMLKEECKWIDIQ